MYNRIISETFALASIFEKHKDQETFYTLRKFFYILPLTAT